MDYLELCKNVQNAINIEEKHQYIDFIGRKSTFSRFILKCLKDIVKQINKLEKPKVQYLITFFEQYPYMTPPDRRLAIEKLIPTLKYFKKQFTPQKTVMTASKKWEDDIEKIDIMYVKGVGPKLASVFQKVGIYTVWDLLSYYPRKYLDFEGKTKIKNLKEGQSVSIIAEIKKVSAYNTSKKITVINILLKDESGSLNVVYFYKALNRKMLERYKAKYPEGAVVIALGTVKQDNYTGHLTLDKPSLEIVNCNIDDRDVNLSHEKIIPVYSLTENLSSKTLIATVLNAMEKYGSNIKDPIPDFLKEKYSLLDKKEAVLKIHFPKNHEDIEQARFRLVFEELFLMQLNFALLREKNKKTYTSLALNIKKNGLVGKFIKSLPFELTNAQKKAVQDILGDLNSTEPMQRLLQGDVGSGKTVVACICLLCAVENGFQGAIMAPTEILAVQHYKNFTQWLTPLNISVGLFLGKHGVKVRREMQTSLKNGQMHIAVGTHSLIQEGVEFNNLGAVVIDEQHRFGVKQRAKLRTKGKYAQMLTMTATPIPRTLALTVHGDLDITIIDEMPKGRLPVKTSMYSTSGHKIAYDLIKKEIEKSHQAYIVYPLIDESETISAKNATQEYEKLSKGVFKNYKLGLLHGKLKAEEKEAVMNDFKNKKYDILVSTTVVEVGVDVPNATVMVIENAERFGLSQLHQLRGRVGRNSEQSYCILISGSNTTTVKQRLGIMCETNNGFVVAEKDLEMRGPGEYLGTRQSGLEQRGLADIVQDVKILEIAREEAFNFVKGKNMKDYPMLAEAIKEKEFTFLEGG